MSFSRPLGPGYYNGAPPVVRFPMHQQMPMGQPPLMGQPPPMGHPPPMGQPLRMPVGQPQLYSKPKRRREVSSDVVYYDYDYTESGIPIKHTPAGENVAVVAEHSNPGNPVQDQNYSYGYNNYSGDVSTQNQQHGTEAHYQSMQQDQSMGYASNYDIHHGDGLEQQQNPQGHYPPPPVGQNHGTSYSNYGYDYNYTGNDTVQPPVSQQQFPIGQDPAGEYYKNVPPPVVQQSQRGGDTDAGHGGYSRPFVAYPAHSKHGMGQQPPVTPVGTPMHGTSMPVAPEFKRFIPVAPSAPIIHGRRDINSSGGSSKMNVNMKTSIQTASKDGRVQLNKSSVAGDYATYGQIDKPVSTPSRDQADVDSFPGDGKTKVCTGIVTQLQDSFGMIGDDIFFQKSAVKGPCPKLGDRVLVEAESVSAMPFKWNSKRVQLVNKDLNINNYNSIEKTGETIEKQKAKAAPPPPSISAPSGGPLKSILKNSNSMARNPPPPPSISKPAKSYMNPPPNLEKYNPDSPEPVDFRSNTFTVPQRFPQSSLAAGPISAGFYPPTGPTSYFQTRPPSPRRLNRSPSPRRINRSPSPRRINRSPSPRRINRSPSPRRINRSPSPRRMNRSPSPRRINRSPSPRRINRSTSPRRINRSPSPRRINRSPSPIRLRRSSSPRRNRRSISPRPTRRSQSPRKSRRSPSPRRPRRSPSPRRSRRSRSPSPRRRRRSSSPRKSKRSPSPRRYRRSPSPKRSKRSPSPGRRQRSSSPKFFHLSPEDGKKVEIKSTLGQLVLSAKPNEISNNSLAAPSPAPSPVNPADSVAQSIQIASSLGNQNFKRPQPIRFPIRAPNKAPLLPNPAYGSRPPLSNETLTVLPNPLHNARSSANISITTAPMQPPPPGVTEERSAPAAGSLSLGRQPPPPGVDGPFMSQSGSAFLNNNSAVFKQQMVVTPMKKHEIHFSTTAENMKKKSKEETGQTPAYVVKDNTNAAQGINHAAGNKLAINTQVLSANLDKVLSELRKKVDAEKLLNSKTAKTTAQQKKVDDYKKTADVKKPGDYKKTVDVKKSGVYKKTADVKKPEVFETGKNSKKGGANESKIWVTDFSKICVPDIEVIEPENDNRHNRRISEDDLLHQTFLDEEQRLINKGDWEEVEKLREEEDKRLRYDEERRLRDLRSEESKLIRIGAPQKEIEEFNRVNGSFETRWAEEQKLIKIREEEERRRRDDPDEEAARRWRRRQILEKEKELRRQEYKRKMQAQREFEGKEFNRSGSPLRHEKRSLSIEKGHPSRPRSPFKGPTVEFVPRNMESVHRRSLSRSRSRSPARLKDPYRRRRISASPPRQHDRRSRRVSYEAYRRSRLQRSSRSRSRELEYEEFVERHEVPPPTPGRKVIIQHEEEIDVAALARAMEMVRRKQEELDQREREIEARIKNTDSLFAKREPDHREDRVQRYNRRDEFSSRDRGGRY